MTAKQKKRILALALFMLITALFICPAPIGKVVIAGVIAVKYYVFLFRVKTIEPEINKSDGSE